MRSKNKELPIIRILMTALGSSLCAAAPSTCPYADPFVYGISCLHNGFSRINYRPISNSRTTTPPPYLAQSLRDKDTVDGEIEIYQNIPPPSTPDLSKNFMEYYCSEQGQAMISCASNLTSRCSEHPRLHRLSFNPDQAEKARRLCSEIKDFEHVEKCLNQTVRTDAYLVCAGNAYEVYSRETAGFETARCRAVASTYNCYAEHGERFCGSTAIDFSIALMRVMEDRHCTPVVETVYQPQRLVSRAPSLQASPLTASVIILCIVNVWLVLRS